LADPKAGYNPFLPFKEKKEPNQTIDYFTRLLGIQGFVVGGDAG